MMPLPTLKKGSAGSAVRRLRCILGLRGYSLAQGELFDTATHNAVVAFQKDMGLEEDGVAGKQTWRKLNEGVREVANWRGWCVALMALGEAARGVRESGGNNRGADVEVYQAATGMRWQPWCASFVTWCYSRMGLHLRDADGFASVKFMTGWAKKAGYWRARATDYVPPVGSIVVFKFSHTGIILAGGGKSDKTVEGNTSSGAAGSQRDGEGVFQRTRRHGQVSGYVVVPEICKLSL